MSELPQKNESAEIAQLREQVSELEKSMENLSYAVSHDLRAPLRAVQGFSVALLEDYGSKLDSDGQRYLNIISDNSKKMAQMIDAILAVSRLGRQTFQISEVNMQALVEEVVAEAKKKPEANRVEFRIGQLPVAKGDLVLLKQVWTNLLSNAVKFSSEKPTPIIEIGGTEKGGQKNYFIRDNGIGFDPQYESKLFALFQRLHSDKEFTGVGAGLALVQLAVHKQGGRTWAEGKINEGATFHFSLPE